jgi:hypothetical protein
MNSTEAALERENQDSINMLGDKVRQLREMSNGLNGTMKEDNKLLGMMDGQFDGASSLLTGAMGKMDMVMKGSKVRCTPWCRVHASRTPSSRSVVCQ